MKLQIAGGNPDAVRIVIGDAVTRHKRRTRRLSDYSHVGRFRAHSHRLLAELRELLLGLLIAGAYLLVLLTATYTALQGALATPLLLLPYLP